jgi:23S rRNA (guanine745-N1)-methyltransferase
VDALPFLRCPYCGGELALGGGALRCSAGHSFDVSRHGHVTLLPAGGKPPAGDTAEMVAAREAFLGAGHFEPIARAVAEEAARPAASGADATAGEDAGGGETGGLGTSGRCVVEVGAGTGYYLARALQGRVGIALDSSRAALRRALKADARIAAVVCDAWRRLPIRDGVAAAVLSVFAPRNVGEMRRILAPDGALVVVTPTPRHLRELVGPLGLVTVDARKPERLDRTLSPWFTALHRDELVLRLHLDEQDVRRLVSMGPSAHHRDAGAPPLSLGGRGALDVTAAFVVTIHRPRNMGC